MARRCGDETADRHSHLQTLSPPDTLTDRHTHLQTHSLIDMLTYRHTQGFKGGILAIPRKISLCELSRYYQLLCQKPTTGTLMCFFFFLTLFWAVVCSLICSCTVGLFLKPSHKQTIPQIQPSQTPCLFHLRESFGLVSKRSWA